MLEAHPGLQEEVIEVYEQVSHATPSVLLSILNGPARIAKRGFQVQAEHLLAVIVDTWRADEKSRWVLYDIDGDRIMPNGRLYRHRSDAVEAADEYNDVIVRRFELP